MKETVFKGVVDDKIFDDLDAFKKYLEQHPNAQRISYSQEVREVEDKVESSIKVKDEKTALIPVLDINNMNLTDDKEVKRYAIGYYNDFVDHYFKFINQNDVNVTYGLKHVQDMKKTNTEQQLINDTARKKVSDRHKADEQKLKTLDNANLVLQIEEQALDRVEELYRNKTKNDQDQIKNNLQKSQSQSTSYSADLLRRINTLFDQLDSWLN